jgi:hypothetical protein
MLDITRRQLLLVLGGVLAITTIAVGIYGLVRQPDAPQPASSQPASDVETVDVAISTPVAVEDRSLPHTTDPIAYARAVSTSLFDWDTTSGLLPTDYTAAVLADADPSGEETPGLLTDVATYLPSTDQWLDLAAMEVSQSLTIEEAVVPKSWAAAVDQARGQLRPGTTAVTITGTRHRAGMWDGEFAEMSYDVAFTVFVACPPAFDRCRVLRLSQLDNPLR